MAGGKETPRQKMIGMMYLVLTALLALNVSKEILNAFVTQDMQGIEQNDNAVESLNAIKTKISLLKEDPQSKKSAAEIEPILLDVYKVSNEADDFFLDELNAVMDASGNGKDWFTKDKGQKNVLKNPLGTMQKQDDYDTPTRIFAGEPKSKGDKRGKALRTKLMEFRDNLILKIASSIKEKNKVYTISKNDLKSQENLEKHLEQQKHPKRDAIMNIYKRLTKPEQIEQVLNGGEVKKKDWNTITFDHQPMVAVVNVFTSLRNDVRLAQLDAAKMLMERVEVPMMNINKVEAQVLATTQYMNYGDTLGVKVGIVAYDSSKQYKIQYRYDSSGDYKEQPDGKFTIKGDGEGKKYVEGKLFVEIAGEMQTRDWSFNYTVGKPSTSVSLPDMNVLYRGYANKVKAVASGYPPSEVSVSCSGCSSFSKGKEGEYIAKVSSAKEATVVVKAGGKKIGDQKFRVFNLPNAQPFFVGKSVGDASISSGSLKQGTKLSAKLPNSPLNVTYTVKSFNMSAVNKGKVLDGGRSSGGSLTSKMKNILKLLKRGDKVFFEQVKIAGPDGKGRPVGGLSFKVK